MAKLKPVLVSMVGAAVLLLLYNKSPVVRKFLGGV